MARCRVVAPKTKRLPLSDGEWIEVKAELNAGETRAVFINSVQSMRADTGITLDPHQVGKARIMQYVVGWSLIGLDEKPLAFSESALESVDFDTFTEIMKAVDDHDDAAEKARAERKNLMAGPIGQTPTSLSLAG